MRKVLLLALFFAICGTGCVTAPKTYSFASSRTYDQSFDETWAKLMKYFTANGYQIRTIEKDSGIVYAEMMQFTSEYADCGSAGLAVVRGGTVSFNMMVTDSQRQTTVTINSSFKQARQFDKSTWQVTCNSKGKLERDLLAALHVSGARRQLSGNEPRQTQSSTRRTQSSTRQSSGNRQIADKIRAHCTSKWQADIQHQQSCIKRMHDGWQEVGNVIARYPTDSQEYRMMSSCWSQWFPQMDRVANCTGDQLSAFHAHGSRNPVPASAVGR